MRSQTAISPARLALYFHSRPEVWIALFTLGAWAVMLPHGFSHWGHTHHHWMTPTGEIGHWMLMVIAMMLPLMRDGLLHVAERSYRHRRLRGMAAFLLGYLAVWLLPGFVAVVLRSFPETHDHRAAAVAFGLAALWTLTPIHKRALHRCHRTIPLAPLGWRADRDALRMGGLVGIGCVTSCTPLMIACALTGHSVVAMTGAFVIGAWERLSFRPPIRRTALAVMALALWHVFLVVQA